MWLMIERKNFACKIFDPKPFPFSHIAFSVLAAKDCTVLLDVTNRDRTTTGQLYSLDEL